ncbi:hypothetical protein [Tardiphaga sp. 839_C3_N1_4]|uniref:LexA family protein n=1 Tax=Tardiphaga sp. 839_C3_N1_4 TaxID=3240761 RepID=UPI003F252E37
MIGLTAVQKNAVTFMVQHNQAAGVYPSFQELADHLGLKSKSRVAEIMDGLEERGAVRRIRRRARAYEVIPDGEGRGVLVDASLWSPLVRYAIAEGCSLETAVNQFIRDGLESA